MMEGRNEYTKLPKKVSGLDDLSIAEENSKLDTQVHF